MTTLGTELHSGIKLKLEFTKELVTTILKKNTIAQKRIQILPDDVLAGYEELTIMMLENNAHLVSLNDVSSHSHEIIFSKTFFKYVFLESYQFIYKQKEFKSVIDSENFEDVRIATFGLLFATSLDSTALRMNLDVLEYLDLSKESLYESYFIVAGFLTCNYEKTNKSSLLWTYFRMLHVWLCDLLPDTTSGTKPIYMDEWDKRGSKEHLFSFAVKTCLRSLELHPRNYYACNSLRFLLSNLNLLKFKEKIYNELITYALRNPEDFSLWMVLCSALIDLRHAELKYYRKEWNRYSKVEGNSEIEEDIGDNESLVDKLYEKIRDFSNEKGCYGGLLAAYRVNSELDGYDNLDSEYLTFYKNFEAHNNVKINTKERCAFDCNTGRKVYFMNTLSRLRDFSLSLNMKKAWEAAVAMDMH